MWITKGSFCLSVFYKSSFQAADANIVIHTFPVGYVWNSENTSDWNVGLAKIITIGVLHEHYEANCLTVSDDNQNSVLSDSFIHSFIPLFSIYLFTHTTYGCGNLCIMQYAFVRLVCDKNINRTNAWN